MQIVRSVLGVIVGGVVAIFLIIVAVTSIFLVFKPDEAPGIDDIGKLMEWMQTFQNDPERACGWIRTLPPTATVVVLLGWEVAAFVGGWIAARIAGHWPLLHAGLIGTFVLIVTALIFSELKKMGVPQPDYMIILGLLLPLPMSLLGGKLAAQPSSETPPPASNP